MPKQDVSIELNYDGGWQEVADETFVSGAITVQRGQGDEGAALRPSSTRLLLDNFTGKYSIAHPQSPLYGKAGRNTPVRASIDGEVVNATEATSWRPNRSIDFVPDPLGLNRRGRGEVQLESYGVLNRVNQWTQTVKSPFREFIEGLPRLVGYWPFEDPQGTLSPENAVPGSVNQTLNFVYGSQKRFAGSGNLADIQDLPASGLPNFLGYNAAGTQGQDDGYQIIFAFSCSPEFGDTGLVQLMGFQDTFIRNYGLSRYDDTQWLVTMTDPNGVGVERFPAIADDFEFSSWTIFVMTVAPDGADFDVTWRYCKEGDTAFTTLDSFTYTGDTGKPRLYAASSAPALVGSTYGHFAVIETDDFDFAASDIFAAINAWKGERAADRFTRLCDSRNIPNSVVGDPEDTPRMGEQTPGKFSEHLQQIRDTDDGMVYDAKTAVELVYRTRESLYAQTPAVELTYGDNVAQPFSELVDDLDIHNIVTVTNQDGGYATARLDEGLMSTQAPPDGVGEYEQEVRVSLSELKLLPDFASWWLNRGTIEDARFNSVTVDLVANPELTETMSALDIGDRIKVSGYFPDDADMLIIGYTDKIGSHSRVITLVTVPGEVFRVGEYEISRYDSRTSTMNAGVDAYATSITVTFDVLRDAWSTTSEPYDLIIEGERLTVTSMGSVSGSGPWTQTATVTRSVNGVVKALTSGSVVRLHPEQHGRYAL